MIDGMIGALGVGLQSTHTRSLTDWTVATRVGIS